MTLISLLSHPASLVVCEYLTTALAISFTSPSSLTRAAALPLLVMATWLITLTCTQRISRLSLSQIFAGNGPAYVLRYLDLVLLSRWSYEAGGPTNSTSWRKTTVGANDDSSAKINDRVQGTVWDRLRFGLHVTASSRHVNTPWEVKNVPYFSNSDPRHIPSRSAFLRHNALVVLVCYFIVDGFSLGLQPGTNAVVYAAQKVPLFARPDHVSTEELTIRIGTSVAVWLNIYCTMGMIYSALAVIAVGNGLSGVSEWRPPYGRLADAYTVRRFWGNFWHQMFRQTFSSPAKFLVDRVLHLTNHRLVARYAKIFATFFLSGLLHLVVDLALGMSLSESGAVRFFCMQAVEIMLEDGVQAMYRRMRGTESALPPSGWARTLGYVWVVAFLSWSTPMYAYPAIRRNHGDAKDRILPFSVLRLMLGWE